MQRHYVFSFHFASNAFVYNVSNAHAVVEVVVTVGPPFPSPSSPLDGSISPCQCAGEGNWMDWPSRLSARDEWNHAFSKRNYSHNKCVSDKQLSNLESPKSSAPNVEKKSKFWQNAIFYGLCAGSFQTTRAFVTLYVYPACILSRLDLKSCKKIPPQKNG